VLSPLVIDLHNQLSFRPSVNNIDQIEEDSRSIVREELRDPPEQEETQFEGQQDSFSGEQAVESANIASSPSRDIVPPIKNFYKEESEYVQDSKLTNISAIHPRPGIMTSMESPGISQEDYQRMFDARKQAMASKNLHFGRNTPSSYKTQQTPTRSLKNTNSVASFNAKNEYSDQKKA
jgi:hypothetical protein